MAENAPREPIARNTSHESDPTYHPQDAIENSVSSGLRVGGAGLLLAAVQNTLTRENIGAFGVFTRYGGTVALFAAMGGTYAFVSTASANLREKNDAYNAGLGGFFAGSLIGLRNRAMPSVLGNGMLLGVILAGVQYTGGYPFNTQQDPNEDKFTEKEELRKRFRRPVNEMINEIGEGRGIYGPGYDERRKQRIKDAYGIEVKEPYYKSP